MNKQINVKGDCRYIWLDDIIYKCTLKGGFCFKICSQFKKMVLIDDLIKEFNEWKERNRKDQCYLIFCTDGTGYVSTNPTQLADTVFDFEDINELQTILKA